MCGDGLPGLPQGTRAGIVLEMVLMGCWASTHSLLAVYPQLREEVINRGACPGIYFS